MKGTASSSATVERDGETADSDANDSQGDEAESSFGGALRLLARLPDASPPPWIPEHAAGARIGRFRIVSRLGRGGMGVVYLALDETLGRNVALKTLPPEVVGDGDRRRRFLREARSASAVVHPNVGTIYEAGESDGIPYIAMEPIAGRTLRALLVEAAAGEVAPAPRRATPRQVGGLAIERAIDIAAQIARGLAEAHRKGVIHRDLKPENVMVGDDGVIKILDFGLAKLRSGPTGGVETDSLASEVGRILGTPGYMSREQAEGTALDERTDIFSLGVILFEMLAGRRPFIGSTPMQIAIAISRDAPPELAAIRPGVPPALSALVARCLEKVPDHRYPSCEALLAELARASAPRAPSITRRVLVVAAVVAGALAIGWAALRPPAIPNAAPEAHGPEPFAAREESDGATTTPVATALPIAALPAASASTTAAAPASTARPVTSARAVKATGRPPGGDPLSDQF